MSDTGGHAANGIGSSPGKLLAAGRASRELTIDEVGDALNLAPHTVEWLESDNFESLPAAAFTRGYIRNYAKLVGLDADAVVATYHDAAGKPDVAWESPREAAGISDLVARHPGVLISAVVAAVGLLILVVLLVVWPDADDTGEVEEPSVAPLDAALQNGGRVAGSVAGAAGSEAVNQTSPPAATGPVTQKQAASSVEPETLPGANQRSTRFDTPGNIDRDAIDPDDPLAHLPVATTYPAPADATGASGGSGVAAEPEQSRSVSTANRSAALGVAGRLTAIGDDKLRFEVVEDCWIAIKTIDNEELYGRLGRAGQTIELTGQAPFRVVLGYAPGAEVYFNDRQILIDRYTRNGVASLVIGQ